jgi:hypothetical protein
MALGNGNHKLPLKAEILKEIAKKPGDKVRITLLERIAEPSSNKPRSKKQGPAGPLRSK